MLDTVSMRLTRNEVAGVDFINATTPILNPMGQRCWQAVGSSAMMITGCIDNLRVAISPYQVKLNGGSLCKWMFGDNYRTMQRDDVRQAIERLSDTLHLPMERARVTRLDIGATFSVDEPIANYFNHLGTLNYAIRLQQPHSLYYHRNSQAERLCFYDKNREQRNHREPIPPTYKGLNVLRYEQRYMARLPALLGVPRITGAMLYDETFYATLLSRWCKAYQAIRKINDVTLNYNAMKGRRDFDRLGRLALIELKGGELGMIADINEAQKRGDLSAKQAFDLRQAVKETCKAREDIITPSAAIIELDSKIKTIAKHYL